MHLRPPPRRHLFVCANRREGSPLGPGCGERGEEVYAALKAEVSRRGEVNETWITKTSCLGMCPAHGTTVACYAQSNEGLIATEVTVADVHRLFAVQTPQPLVSTALKQSLDALEELQRKKVLDLARRLKPGLTFEDVQNPHDFPELDDPDWHYADGVLTGIQSVKSAVLAHEGEQSARATDDGDT